MNIVSYIPLKRLAAAALTLVLGAGAPGSAGAEYEISWFTIDCGGGQSSDAAYVVTGTIGQPDAGNLSGGAFELRGGFWVITAGIAPTCDDFDGDGDVDEIDFAQFAACMGGPEFAPAETCAPGIDADCDGDGDVDLADFASFAAHVG